MLKSFPIRHKLLLIVALFLVPISLQVFLFLQQSRKDITFASAEIDGVTYLQSAWPALHRLIQGMGDEKTTGDSAIVSGLKKQAAAFDVPMKSDKSSAAALSALEKAGWPGGAIKRSTDSEAAVAALRTLVNDIGNNSNLILDPDLDSFYVMDLTVVKLPEVIDAAGALLGAARKNKATGTLPFATKADFLIGIGRFKTAASGAAGSIAAAISGNGDGTVKAALDAPTGDLATAAKAFADELQKISQG